VGHLETTARCFMKRAATFPSRFNHRRSATGIECWEDGRLPDRGRGLVSSGSLAYARTPDLLKAFRFAFRDVGEEVGAVGAFLLSRAAPTLASGRCQKVY
jgi:hypothetical protein